MLDEEREEIEAALTEASVCREVAGVDGATRRPELGLPVDCRETERRRAKGGASEEGEREMRTALGSYPLKQGHRQEVASTAATACPWPESQEEDGRRERKDIL